MRFVIPLSSCLTLVALAMSSWTASQAVAADKPGRVLRHIVMYKFKDDLTAAQLQEVIDTFSALPKKVDTIIDFERGTNVSGEGKSEGFTHVFVVTFRDEKGRDAYLVHPAHQEYVTLARDKRDKVVVFDYWADR
jgi:hypothetical protein